MSAKLPRQKTNKYANLRKEEVLETPSFIVIAVEGERTERLYFEMLEKKFRDKIRLKIIAPEKGKSSPQKILDVLRNQKAEYASSSSNKNPDSFWMVCDVDLHKGVHSVIKDALKEGFKVAISNPCFEVWLFLHLGKIEIKKDVTRLLNLKGEVLLEVRKDGKVDRKLSQKISNILGHIRNGIYGYEKPYLDELKKAVLRSSRNLKKVEKDNLLVGIKYVGQTRVGELIDEIMK